jgi:hypothetical protein
VKNFGGLVPLDVAPKDDALMVRFFSGKLDADATLLSPASRSPTPGRLPASGRSNSVSEDSRPGRVKSADSLSQAIEPDTARRLVRSSSSADGIHGSSALLHPLNQRPSPPLATAKSNILPAATATSAVVTAGTARVAFADMPSEHPPLHADLAHPSSPPPREPSAAVAAVAAATHPASPLICSPPTSLPTSAGEEDTVPGGGRALTGHTCTHSPSPPPPVEVSALAAVGSANAAQPVDAYAYAHHGPYDMDEEETELATDEESNEETHEAKDVDMNGDARANAPKPPDTPDTTHLAVVRPLLPVATPVPQKPHTRAPPTLDSARASSPPPAHSRSSSASATTCTSARMSPPTPLSTSALAQLPAAALPSHLTVQQDQQPVDPPAPTEEVAALLCSLEESGERDDEDEIQAPSSKHW